MNELIYVVDDDRDLRDSVAEILENNEYAVRTFESAESALQELRSETPAIVIMDYMMPGIGGMAAIPLMKKVQPSLKIIMVTAFSTVDNAVTAMKNGANDYLAKPFKRNDLLVAVKRSLEELKFENQFAGPEMDEALACLSNQIRRKILSALSTRGPMRFMDITRHLEISDHTKVNFHLKNLKNNNLIASDRKYYQLTSDGQKIVDCLAVLYQKIS